MLKSSRKKMKVLTRKKVKFVSSKIIIDIFFLMPQMIVISTSGMSRWCCNHLVSKYFGKSGKLLLVFRFESDASVWYLIWYFVWKCFIWLCCFCLMFDLMFAEVWGILKILSSFYSRYKYNYIPCRDSWINRLYFNI